MPTVRPRGVGPTFATVMDHVADLEQRLDHILSDAMEAEGEERGVEDGAEERKDASEAASCSTSMNGEQTRLQDNDLDHGTCSTSQRQLLRQMFGDVRRKRRNRASVDQTEQHDRSKLPERDKEEVLGGLSKIVKTLQETVDAESIKPQLANGEEWRVPEAFDDASGLPDPSGKDVHSRQDADATLEEWVGHHHLCHLPSVRQVFHGEVSSLAVQGRFAVVGTTQGYITLAFEKQKSDDESPLVVENSLVGQSPALRFYPCKVPVTAVDVSIESNMIVTGHSDGSLNIWDPHRGNSVKEIKKEHDHAVLHCKFIAGPVCQLLTACTTGVLYLHVVVHIPFIKKITVNSRCLLDGKRLGAILGLDVFSQSNSQKIPENEETKSVLALTDHNQNRGWSSLVSLLTCEKIIIVQISPSICMVKELPYPGGMRVSPEGPLPSCSWKPTNRTCCIPVLAVVLDKQLHLVYFCNSSASRGSSKATGTAWSDPTAWIAAEVQDLTNVAISVGWLSRGRCCVLHEDGRAVVYAPLLQDQHQTKTLQVPIHSTTIEPALNVIPAYHQCFLNELGYSGKWYGGCSTPWDNAMFLCSEQGDVHLLKAFTLEEHVAILGRQGKWADALHQGSRALKAQQKRTSGAQFSQDLIHLILFVMNRFIDEQFEGHRSNDAAMLQLGQVCLQIVVLLGHGDDLISVLFDRFRLEGSVSLFLSALEHFVLNDRLRELPPEIVQHLVEELSMKDQPWRIEECVMHLEITTLDLNQLFGLCKKHKLYNTMIYLYQEALNDNLTPLVTLLHESSRSSGDTKAILQSKLYSYLACCFHGYLYPAWRGSLSNGSWTKAEIIALCLYCRIAGSEGRILEELIHLHGSWTIGLLHVAFKTWDSTEPELVSILQKAHLAGSVELHGNVEGQKSACQAVSNVIVATLAEFDSESGDLEAELCKIEFLLSLRASERIVISQAAFKHMEALLRQLALHASDDKVSLVELLLVQVLRFWGSDQDTLSGLAEFASTNKLYILSAYISSANKNYADSLLHLLQSPDEGAVFMYLEDTLCEAKERPNSIAATLVTNEDENAFMDAMLGVVGSLVSRDVHRTVRLVCTFVPDRIPGVIHSLVDQPFMLFQFLDTLMQGGFVNEYNLSPEVYSNLDVSMLYVNLLCQFRPSAVLGFLQSNETIQIDDCLEVCRKYEIKDAEAFILERMGQMTDSLVILLGFLSDADYDFVSTVLESTAVESATSWLPPEDKDDHAALLVQVDQYGASKGLFDVNSALDQCISFCQRNADKIQERGTLWFALLESLIVPMQHLKHAQSKVGNDNDQEFGKMSLLHCVHAALVSRVMVYMAGYVPLQAILQGILSRYRSSEVGDFRSTLVSLLEACSFEHAILKQANRLVLDNAFEQVMEYVRRTSCAHPGRVMEDSTGKAIQNANPSVPSSLQLFEELWQWINLEGTCPSFRQPGSLPSEPRFRGRIKERLAHRSSIS